jgi:hypothetical protein
VQTLYQHGREKILELIGSYLEILNFSDGLKGITPEHFERIDWRIFLCCGRGIPFPAVPTSAIDAYRDYNSRAAVPHDLETAVSGPLFAEMMTYAFKLAQQASRVSHEFTTITAETLFEQPELVPIFLHATGSFSKSILQKEVGQISDTSISRPSAKRLSHFFSSRFNSTVAIPQIVDRLGSTIEGQMRDLLGRYLLEALVEAALMRLDIPFQRESEYESLAGMVYDHRADFVIPRADHPQMFIEVRKSSARHSSLYAKDKMFSAINWKGKNQNLIGVLIADGEWSRQALLALAKVFDYVLPVNEADTIARIASAYLAGDEAMLRRVIHFSIDERLAPSD